MGNDIRIIADYREKPSRIPEMLIEKGVNSGIDNLTAGDYMIDGQVLVERKTDQDFIQSLLNNRIFEQCSKLKRKSDFQLFIIEGDLYFTNHKISRNAIQGALLSISVAWQIPVFFTKNTIETTDVLIMISKQRLQNKNLALRRGYKPKKIKNQQLFFLQGLPSIGPSLAYRLLLSFGSIGNVLNASVEDLVEIDGIGKTKAIKVKEFMKNKFTTI